MFIFVVMQLFFVFLMFNLFSVFDSLSLWNCFTSLCGHFASFLNGFHPRIQYHYYINRSTEQSRIKEKQQIHLQNWNHEIEHFLSTTAF